MSTITANGSRMYTVLDNPFSRLTLVATDGALSGLYMDLQRHRPPDETFGVPAPDPTAEPFRSVTEQLAAYFAGELTDFDLPLNLRGTPFQQRVWAALQDIPYGETISYGELAVEIGNPSASRAVGLANGRNPVSIIVPCHRVVGSTGSLTGYGGGLERKRLLLDFERGIRTGAAGAAETLF
ncbi:methylated-DNA--[protein]-cysteine S-methyltransferase [Spirillospora sp. NBC_01491]|uniref:methylated-DNA--[protein]-cysteine S-methyltransferase n=1 Tax=Spirillospora sp. NBC_01491 TaxID=2976007 RepID=UPI002E300C66|nr:methylated-DNA--[protein]-cysteine S-methyltransferase [Spirillospora sp. NBC_01491]